MWRRFLVRWLPLTMVTTVVTTGLLGVPGSLHPVVADQVMQVKSRTAGVLHDVHLRQAVELVGFSWSGSGAARIQLRAATRRGWHGWTTITGSDDTGSDVNGRRGPNTAGPVWVGRGVTRVQFRVLTDQSTRLRLHAIRSENGGTSSTIVSADAAARQPWFTTRSRWGADETWRGSSPGCNGTPAYANTVRNVIIHDTDTSNNYGPADSAAIVRAIYFFHAKVNQWCDVGYNFLVDRFGQIFEGRYGGIDRPVIGAHAGGFNVGSAGIGLIGLYDKDNPPRAMYTALRLLVTWIASTYRIRANGMVTLTTGDFPDANWPPGTVATVPAISGHRDLDKTDCPGDKAYALLGRLRTDVARATGLR